MADKNTQQQQTKTEDLFSVFVRVDDSTGCWNWGGGRNRLGYGVLKRLFKGKKYNFAHRLAYAVLVGAIPEGFTIDHMCKNRACVNPAHMEPVPLAENIRRRGGTSGSDRNRRKTHCPRGHRYDKTRKHGDGHISRYCSICNRESARRAKRRAGADSRHSAKA